ncbi:MAG TPA: hypothetical protein DCP28_24915, partial [Cytophagales bacterium]|nr:hypothetical protein [Cytophagales bacterium]
GQTKLETANNIWTFCYTHFQYKEDRKDREELRTPARAWHDRKSGIDCDCFSILVLALCNELGLEAVV